VHWAANILWEAGLEQRRWRSLRELRKAKFQTLPWQSTRPTKEKPLAPLSQLWTFETLLLGMHFSMDQLVDLGSSLYIAPEFGVRIN
jgi:hypothetical protein